MLQTGAQKNYIKEETLERLKVDEEVLGEFFRDVLNPAVCFLLPLYTYLHPQLGAGEVSGEY
jgi:hypothetical protein